MDATDDLLQELEKLAADDRTSLDRLAMQVLSTSLKILQRLKTKAAKSENITVNAYSTTEDEVAKVLAAFNRLQE